MPYTHLVVLKYWRSLCLLLCFPSSAEQVEQVSNTCTGRMGNTRGPRRSAKPQKIDHRTAPYPPPSRRSARLEFPGVSPPSPPPLPVRRCKRKTPFPLMNLPRELRDLVYSEALALDYKALLRVSKQVREEARPYLWESSFLKLGRDREMLILDSPGPQPKKLLYPSLPAAIRNVELAYHDRVLYKLALIQNLAIKIDFDNLYDKSSYPPPMLGQAPPRHFRTMQTSRLRRPRPGDHRGSPLDRPIGLLEPFLSPQSSSDRRNTCEITLEHFTHEKTLLSQAVGVLARLDKFRNIFVTFESPELCEPEQLGGRRRRRFNAVKEPLEAAFGPAIWHEGNIRQAGYLAFHPGRKRTIRGSG